MTNLSISLKSSIMYLLFLCIQYTLPLRFALRNIKKPLMISQISKVYPVSLPNSEREPIIMEYLKLIRFCQYFHAITFFHLLRDFMCVYNQGRRNGKR